MRVIVIAAAVTATGLHPAVASAQAKPIAEQIAEAVFALPEADRTGAKVWGWQDGAETMVILRPGTNDHVCLADKPGDDRFEASCYDARLEPFMARGRELRAEGKGTGEVRRIRQSEIEAGTLALPDSSRLISLRGQINPGSGRPDSVSVLRVVYLPHATAESAGVPASAPRGERFLMEAGTYRAHLMIPSGRIPFTP
ncbi:MAG TPA: hypothetical protein VK845_09715 [Gemmatimonadales bacterium]|nr:hypothetical protein [Gemmatimonadales bacterium]